MRFAEEKKQSMGQEVKILPFFTFKLACLRKLHAIRWFNFVKNSARKNRGAEIKPLLNLNYKMKKVFNLIGITSGTLSY